jgi:hypothetical protein
MGSSKRSKRSLAATCSAFSKVPGARARAASLFYLLAALACPPGAVADSGVVNSTGAGRDTPEAITSLLRNTVGRYFKENPQLTRAILQTEILPNASSFVQSYKVNEGSHGGAVSLSANVDLDVIHGLLSLTPANLGEKDGAKALVIVRGAKLPDSVIAGLKSKAPPADPFAPLAEPEEVQSMGAGDDMSSPELLRGLGAKAGARVVLAVTARFEAYENENAHNKEERLVLSAVLVDVKTGVALGRASVNVVNPKTRREIYIADLQRNLLDESKDLFQDVFVSAGRKLGKIESHDEFSVVRVLFPSNSTLVARFKTMLEGVPGVRSVTEYSVKRGRFDFAVRPAQNDAALAKAVAGLQAPDVAVAAVDLLSAAGETEAHPPAVSVKLQPKEAAVPAGAAAPNEGGANAVPNPHR